MSTPWQGRVDPPGPADTRRWHQVVMQDTARAAPGIALLGLASDEGVRRNGGRVGAAQGPLMLRRALANLPVLHALPLYDAGDVSCIDEELEQAQQIYAERARRLLDAGHLVVGLGGGHEIGFASYAGLRAHLGDAPQRVGIFNFDAHFDLREQHTASSGTPFLQAIEDARAQGHAVRYHCIGVSRSSNTPGLFAVAERVDARHLCDDALSAWNWREQADTVRAWCDEVDAIYLTLCLDVLPQAVAPGVSAPNPRGIGLDVLEALLDLVYASGKVRILDVAELCPPLDRDNATARVAARLIHRAVGQR